MTREERTAFDVLLGEFRQFREADNKWKADLEGRLRAVEVYVTSEQATDRVLSARTISARAKAAIFVSAIGVVSSVIFGAIGLARWVYELAV